MHPLLLTIDNFSVSSFGFFLSLAFLTAVFVIWRLCRVYDIDEEKTLDIALLSFFGGLIGARVFYVLTNTAQFADLQRVFLVNRYPGLNFWGGIIFGFLTLQLIVKHFRLQLWQMADFVTVGVFAGLILGSTGCILGSCQYGVVSSSPLAVLQVGVLERRFPVQLLAALLYFFAYLYLWKICLRFHFNGKVTSAGLIILGLVKFFTEFLRGDAQNLVGNFTVNQLFAVVAFFLGFVVLYTQGKRSVKGDLHSCLKFFINNNFRRMALAKMFKGWYNFRINWKVSLQRSRRKFVSNTKSLLRNINVKKNPPQFQ